MNADYHICVIYIFSCG